jgi:CHAT domain-containing protein
LIEEGLTNAQAIGDRQVEDLAQNALSFAKRKQSPLAIKADRLLQKGIDEQIAQNDAAALLSWKQALNLWRETGDQDDELSTLAYLAQTYDNLHAYQEASDYYQQYLSLARVLHDRGKEAMALGNLSSMYAALGDNEEALALLQKSQAIMHEIGDRIGEGGDLLNLGVYYYSHNDESKGIGYLREALNIGHETGNDVLEARAIGALGVAYYSIGDYLTAADYQRQLLEMSTRNKQPSGRLASLGNLALLHSAQGNYSKAIDESQRALAIARQIKFDVSESQLLSNLGSIFYEAGRPVDAERTLLAAMKLRESAKQQQQLASNDADKVTAFEQRRNTYQILQQALVAQNKTDEALEVAERDRARVFVELIAKRLAATQPTQTMVMPPRIAQIRNVALTEKSTLIEYSIIYHTVDVGGRRQELESEIYIWVIKPTGEIIFRHSDLNPVLRPQNMSLSDLVFRVRRSIGARGLPIIDAQEPIPAGTSLDLSQKSGDATQNRPLRQLYQVLIAPIAELLPADAKERITFIPEGPLFLIPFSALQDANGIYFVEQHTFFAAPSIQALQLTREERQRSGAISLGSVRAEEALVVGNPTMPSLPAEPGQPSKPLPSLPGAEKEATAIASLFNAEAIIGDEATKDTVVRRLRSARIAHFATHGLLDEVRGIGSAIVLALLEKTMVYLRRIKYLIYH